MKLLTPASYQTKLRKTENGQTEFSVFSLALAPADSAGGATVCSHSVPSCRRFCVGGANSGMARVFASIMSARTEKVKYLQSDKEGFIAQLKREIRLAEIATTNQGRRMAVRLNSFSDLSVEDWGIMQETPSVVYYDYTKRLHRTVLPENYSLCYSWDGETAKNARGCLELLERGFNVSVIFAQRGNGFCGSGALRQRIPQRHRLPGSDRVWACFDGDEQDLRIRGIDPGPTKRGAGRICALRLKTATETERQAALPFCQIID